MHDTDARSFIEYADCGEAQWLWAADDGCEHLPVDGRLPDPDDPATAGCLLAMLAPYDITAHLHTPCKGGPFYIEQWALNDSWSDPVRFEASSVGRCCILVAQSLGRWPGGKE